MSIALMLIPNLTAILGDKDFYSHFTDVRVETLLLKSLSHRCSREEQGFKPRTDDFKVGALFNLSQLLFEM